MSDNMLNVLPRGVKIKNAGLIILISMGILPFVL